MNWYTIHIDDRTFRLREEAINKYPESLLAKVIKKDKTDPYVSVEGNVINVDRDPQAFSYIVDVYRGYPCDSWEISDSRLRHKVDHDLKHFGFKDCMRETFSETDDGDVSRLLTCSGDGGDDDTVSDNIGFLSKFLTSTKTVPRTEQNGGENLESNVLNGNNEAGIKNYIDGLQKKLQEENPTDLIHNISNDPNFRQIIARHNKRMTKMMEETDSPIENLDFTD